MIKQLKSIYNKISDKLRRKWGGGKVAITDVSNVIAQIEGWFVPNSLAQRNNNPGNLRFVGQAGAVQGEGGFAKFATPDDGFNALNNQISLDASRGLDVSGFLNKYAPSSENDTNNYISLFTKMLGVSPTDKLSDILGTGIVDAANTDGTPTDGGIGTVIIASVGIGLLWMLMNRG
jgi:hypothetical protein